MTVSYTKDQRAIAAVQDLSLVTVDVPGCQFQGPVPKDTARALLQWLTNNVFKKQQATKAGED